MYRTSKNSLDSSPRNSEVESIIPFTKSKTLFQQIYTKIKGIKISTVSYYKMIG